MSDSPRSGQRPADEVIAAALVRAVEDVFEAGQIETLSVNGVRTAVEAQLGLPPAFLKTEGTWREKSKDIVHAEFVSAASSAAARGEARR